MAGELAQFWFVVESVEMRETAGEEDEDQVMRAWNVVRALGSGDLGVAGTGGAEQGAIEGRAADDAAGGVSQEIATIRQCHLQFSSRARGGAKGEAGMSLACAAIPPTGNASNLRQLWPVHDAATGRRVVFFCAFGERSAMAVAAAKNAGLANTAHIEGGIDAWKKVGGPVVHG